MKVTYTNKIEHISKSVLFSLVCQTIVVVFDFTLIYKIIKKRHFDSVSDYSQMSWSGPSQKPWWQEWKVSGLLRALLHPLTRRMREMWSTIPSCPSWTVLCYARNQYLNINHYSPPVHWRNNQLALHHLTRSHFLCCKIQWLESIQKYIIRNFNTPRQYIHCTLYRYLQRAE